MTRQGLSDLLARFRRQMLAARLLRWALGAVLLGGFIACYQADHTTRYWILAVLAVVCGLWIALALRGLKALKRARIGTALLAAGRIDEGCTVLAQALKGFTPLHGPKILACHQLAIAAHLQSYQGFASGPSQPPATGPTFRWIRAIRATRDLTRG